MRYRRIEILLFGLASLLALTNAASILALFPAPFKSRFTFNEAIMKSLYEAGHKITFINPFLPSSENENYTTINSSLEKSIFTGQVTLWQFTDMNTISLLESHESTFEKHCYDDMKLKAIQEILKSTEKLYDIMFIDLVSPILQCYLPIAEKLDIPVIGTVASRSWKLSDFAIGFPSNPVTVPFEFFAASGPVMTFSERLESAWGHFLVNFHCQFVTRRKLDYFYQKYFPNMELNKKISMVFYNNHASFFPRLSIPNAIDIGGIHIKPEKPLPQDLQRFIDEAEYGVILFTFGSTLNASSLPVELKSAFVNAFASIPQRVIWKYEESIEGISDNVLLSKWVPQFDILSHRNVKAFISHCGLAGVYEAIHTGTPIISCPVYVDQHLNAALLEKLGVGVPLDLKTVTTTKLLNALNTIVNDTRYFERMQELSWIFKDRPMSPQQSVVYWTEYVLRHNGASHLQAVGSEMPLYQYFLLDVILLVAVIIIATLFTILYVFKKLFITLKNRWVKLGTPTKEEKKIH